MGSVCVKSKQADEIDEVYANEGLSNSYNKEREKDEKKAEKVLEKKVAKAEDYNKDAAVLEDARLSISADRLRRYEVSLPFDNISLGAFFDILISIEEKDSNGKGEGYFTYEQLVASMATNNFWRDALKDRNTPTSKLILHSDFAAEGQAEGCIDLNMVISLALLHCPTEKASTPKVFYKVLQSGGV